MFLVHSSGMIIDYFVAASQCIPVSEDNINNT